MSNHIREMISAGQLEDALHQIVTHAARVNPGLSDDATLLLSRLRTMEREGSLGLITQEQRAIQRTQITQGALRLAGEIGSMVPEAHISSQNESSIPESPETTMASTSENKPGRRVPGRPLHVFVSYAHGTDNIAGPQSHILDALLTQLKPLVREGVADVWSDRRIESGALFEEDIQTAINGADAAILLIDSRFLASDYIYQHELPLLLDKWRSGTLTFFPLILEPCDLAGARFKYPNPQMGPHEIILNNIQAAHSPKHPLSGQSDVDVSTILAGIASRIRSLAESV